MIAFCLWENNLIYRFYSMLDRDYFMFAHKHILDIFLQYFIVQFLLFVFFNQLLHILIIVIIVVIITLLLFPRILRYQSIREWYDNANIFTNWFWNISIQFFYLLFPLFNCVIFDFLWNFHSLTFFQFIIAFPHLLFIKQWTSFLFIV